MFGIEIRKTGTISTLYEEVDKVLANNKIKINEVSDSVKIQAVAHSLQKMLKVDRHFSVCTIRHCADVCQVCISDERMNIYQATHCIDWAEMLPDFRQTLVAMILDDFRIVLNP